MNNITVQDIQSEKIEELASALSKMQGDLKGAKKEVLNSFFKCKYADLNSCWEACRDVLKENGLSVTQTSLPWTDGKLMVTTLLHSSGQFIRSFMPMPYSVPEQPAKSDKYGKLVPAQPARHMTSQEIGSSYTYFRRYSLCGILGISPEDDDGNIASRNTPQPAPAPAPIAKIGPGQAKILLDLVEQCPSDYQQNFFAHIRNAPISAQQISDIPLSHFETLKVSLQRKASEKQQEKQDDRL